MCTTARVPNQCSILLEWRTAHCESPSKMPHFRAALAIQISCVPSLECHTYQVARRAGTCTTTRILVWYPILWSIDQLAPTPPKGTAVACGLNYLDKTRSRYR